MRERRARLQPCNTRDDSVAKERVHIHRHSIDADVKGACRREALAESCQKHPRWWCCCERKGTCNHAEKDARFVRTRLGDAIQRGHARDGFIGGVRLGRVVDASTEQRGCTGRWCGKRGGDLRAVGARKVRTRGPCVRLEQRDEKERGGREVQLHAWERGRKGGDEAAKCRALLGGCLVLSLEAPAREHAVGLKDEHARARIHGD